MTVQPLAAWKRAPMIRLAAPYMLGIGIQYFFKTGLEYWVALLSLSLLILGLIQTLSAWQSFRFRLIRGCLVYCLLLSSGALTCCGAQGRERKANSLHGIHLPFVLTIEETLQRKEKSYSTLASLQLVRKGRMQSIPGKCIVYLQLTEHTGKIRPGERIYTQMQLQGIRMPLNPGDINFRDLYAHKGIYSQVYLPDNRIAVLPGKDKNRARDAQLNQREFILNTLRRYIRDTASIGLAEAILIGYRANLQQELSAAYARTGVMHVIAISGLHISLIFSIMLSAFRLIPVYGKNPWLPLLLAIPVIWWFSVLTGASASVMRSAVMSTMPVLAAVLRRRTNSLNTLAASAMTLLAFQPGWLWDTGFQLSYAAVLGIILYQQKIYRSLFFKHPFAIAAWSLVSVTLAAQVFTTPLVLYYFKQFPIFFLVSNLLAVPLSSLILLSELLVCGLCNLPDWAAHAGKLCTWLIRFLNDFITRMDQVPFSVIRHIYIDTAALCMLFGLIAGIHGALQTGRRAWLAFSCCLALVLSGWQVYQAVHANTSQGLLVLQLNGQTALLQLEGRLARQYIRPSGEGNPARLISTLEKVRQHHRVLRHENRMLSHVGIQLLWTGKRRVLLVSGSTLPMEWSKDMVPDMILLTGNSGTSLAQWQQLTGCRLFVADGSNAMWKIQQWQKEAEKLPLRLHSTPQQGAFLLD